MWNKRVKARLILISSTNTNRESVAYRSFRPSEFEARGVRKVTTAVSYTHLSLALLVSDVAHAEGRRRVGVTRPRIGPPETKSASEVSSVPPAIGRRRHEANAAGALEPTSRTPGGELDEGNVYRARLPVGRVAARKHFSTQQAQGARTSDGTRAPGVGRTAAGVLQAVTGPRQLMRQRSRYDRAIQSIPPRWARRVCLRGRRPKVHRAREKRKTHRATGLSLIHI